MKDNAARAKKPADVPNEDARTERTCHFCGECDAKVSQHSFQTEPWPAVAFHDSCAPPLPDLIPHFREEFDG